jgi:hypothetical protein
MTDGLHLGAGTQKDEDTDQAEPEVVEEADSDQGHTEVSGDPPGYLGRL